MEMKDGLDAELTVFTVSVGLHKHSADDVGASVGAAVGAGVGHG